jgi:phosphoenolpyruvate carboxylase
MVLSKNKGFGDELQERLTGIYIDEIVGSRDSGLAALIRRKEKLAQIRDDDERIDAYIAFWNTLPAARQLALAQEEARLGHIARRLRIFATTAVVQAHNALKATTAGSADFVVRCCRENNVAASQLQEFIDENCVAWFSLTGHPTNPTTVDYTVAETKLMRLLARPDGTPAELRAALRLLNETPVIGPRKSPLDETRETLNTLDTIYDTALAHKKLFENALEKYGYAAEGVEIRTPLIRPGSWTLGDGDGNDSLTAEVLEQGIALHRDHIRRRYLESAKNLEARALIEQAFTARNFDVPALQRALEKTGEHDLAYLAGCFGFGFCVIDIRHNARDIMTTMARLAHVNGFADEASFHALPVRAQEGMIANWLETPEITRTFLATPAEKLKGGDKGDAAARVFGRLQVIGRNPDMCDKLIIAETTHPAQALAALALLQGAGNKIAHEDSRIDIVILSESVADLAGISGTLQEMLENDMFRRHVVSRERLLAMIAKSDTTRQDGRGEAEYAQYEAAVDVFRTAEKMKQKYPELENVLTSVKNGGGNALQRGGGRVTETPALHGRAAADARTTDMGPSTLTIQGQQQGILFSPGRTAIGTLEALAAQNLYSKAGIHGEMPPPEAETGINRQYAQADSRHFARAAGQSFDRLAKQTTAVDDLLAAGPWLAMKAGICCYLHSYVVD